MIPNVDLLCSAIHAAISEVSSVRTITTGEVMDACLHCLVETAKQSSNYIATDFRGQAHAAIDDLTKEE